MELQAFPEVASLSANATTSVIMAIDFNDTTQPAEIVIVTSKKSFPAKIIAPVGELLQPNTITEKDFLSRRGKLTAPKHFMLVLRYNVDLRCL